MNNRHSVFFIDAGFLWSTYIGAPLSVGFPSFPGGPGTPSSWEHALICLIHDKGGALGWTRGLRLLACFSWRGQLCCFLLCLFLHSSIYLVTHHFYLRSLLLWWFFHFKAIGVRSASVSFIWNGTREAISELFFLTVDLRLCYFLRSGDILQDASQSSSHTPSPKASADCPAPPPQPDLFPLEEMLPSTERVEFLVQSGVSIQDWPVSPKWLFCSSMGFWPWQEVWWVGANVHIREKGPAEPMRLVDRV